MTTTPNDRLPLQILLPEQFQRAEARSQLLKETCKHQRIPIDSSVLKTAGCKAMLDTMYKDDNTQFLQAVTRVANALSASADDLRHEINLVFWFCAHYGRLECMKTIAAKLPIDLNYVHKCGHSVIVRAILNDHIGVVEWLLSAGVQHAAFTDSKFLAICSHSGAQRTVDFLRGYVGADIQQSVPFPMEGVAADTLA